MAPPSRPSSSSSSRKPTVPRPSSSIVLLSPTNEVLLLHRVQTSTSFASAHVFPGGNLDAFHDGDIPPEDSPARHADGPAYRLGAVRECFEETGILLARNKDGALLSLSVTERDAVRKRIHGNEVGFGEWLRSVGAEPDLDGLVPFTRWITPAVMPKRFSTQMYLYALPISQTGLPSEIHVPTADGGVEHTAAVFAPAGEFLSKVASSSMIIFPPQVYLLHLVNQFTKDAPAAGSDTKAHYARQRERLLEFIHRTPTAESENGRKHATASISWGDKVMSPMPLFTRGSDGRAVFGLEYPGPELEGTARGGDWDRVTVAKFGKGVPRMVEIRGREEMLAEEAKAEGSKL